MRRIVENTVWLFADRIGRMGIGLLLAVWVARSLGPEQFRLWNYVLALSAIFSFIAGLGLDGIVVRELVKSADRSHDILGSAALLKLGAGAIALGPCLTAVAYLRPGDALAFEPSRMLRDGLVRIPRYRPVESEIFAFKNIVAIRRDIS